MFICIKKSIQLLAVGLFFCGQASASQPLLEAVEAGDVDEVTAIIAAGGDVNKKYGEFKTPVIFYTVGFDEHLNVMELLAKNGANVNAVDSFGSTLLMKATQFGSLEFIESILAKGVDSNQQDKDQSFPLYLACTMGKTDVATLLIKHGADVNKVTGGITFGYSPLIAATISGKVDLVELLLSKGADKTYKSSDGNALYIATAFGHGEIVDLLK